MQILLNACIKVIAAAFTASSLLPAQPVRLSLAVDLGGSGFSQYNVDHTARGLRLRRSPAPQAAAELVREGFYVTSAIDVRRPTNRIRPLLRAQTPPGSSVTVELRGRTSADRWTEWREADGQDVVLPAYATRLQTRITLRQQGTGREPEVLGLRLLVVDQAGEQQDEAAGPPLTARVYATSIGMVGSRTANGHVITAADRFAALPSRRSLNAGARERAYQVKVCYGRTARCVVAPVWDVGPWNIRDDYWNPAASRQMWKDLPRGVPEAQAAYLDRYNRGRDDGKRRVRNPAGIDLSDSLFRDGLGLTTNDWVTVTFLWTGTYALT